MDRAWVLYDADKPATERNRISRKNHQLPEIARLRVTLEDHDAVLRLEDGERSPLYVPFVTEGEPNCTVNEFDTPTPAIDAGDEAAEWFADGFPRSQELGRIRLAQKTSEWLLGFGLSPHERRVAPLHIVTVQSIEEAKHTADSELIDHRRFRPNVLVDAPEFTSGDERHWLEFRLGELVVSLKGDTVRCEYIGQDPTTGDNVGDLSVGKLPVKSKFGIYVFPILEPGELALVQLHDTVEVLSKAT
jgi:uncharacterized protein YcbX